MLQQKDNVILGKGNKLQSMARFMLEKGFTKEEILSETGIRID